MTNIQVEAVKDAIRRTRSEFTPDGIAYALRFSFKLSKYDVLEVIDRMPEVFKVAHQLYRRETEFDRLNHGPFEHPVVEPELDEVSKGFEDYKNR